MKNINKIILLFILLTIGFLVTVYYAWNTTGNISPEISLHHTSLLSKIKSKAIAASCGSTLHGNPDEFTSCTTSCSDGSIVTGTSQCGGACSASCPTCSNGATNYPACNNNVCTNGATNFPACNNVCTNGATNYPACNNQCVPCTVSNICGVDSVGQNCNNTGCNAVADNSICIQNFKTSVDNVSPNGSVEFSWSIPSVASVTPKCSFVDLTTATARPIPGLQDLDPATDRVRITNIQTTTRFCLVCQFFSLSNSAFLGETAAHQWVRVIRVGED